MNENYRNKDFKFMNVPKMDFKQFFKPCKVSSEASDIVQKLLCYNPQERTTALEALCHPFFDDLRSSEFSGLPGGKPLPPKFFEFTEEEYSRATPR